MLPTMRYDDVGDTGKVKVMLCNTSIKDPYRILLFAQHDVVIGFAKVSTLLYPSLSINIRRIKISFSWVEWGNVLYTFVTKRVSLAVWLLLHYHRCFLSISPGSDRERK